MNGVFRAAEDVCRQYTENIMYLSQQQEAICAQREAESREKAAQIMEDAQKQAEETVSSTQRQCAEMLEKAKTESQKYWNAVSEKLTTISNEHEELRHLFSQLPALDRGEKR